MLATALGGPFAGLAAGALVKALGKDGEVDPQDGTAVDAMLSDAVMKPDQVAQIKLAELDFKKAMAELNIRKATDLERIAAGDRDSARNREELVKDQIPAILALAVTVGFFGILGYTLKWEIPEKSQALVNIMLGSLGTAWISIISYYFGSSAGSDRKTELLGQRTGS